MADLPNTQRFDGGNTEVLTVPASTAAAPAAVDDRSGPTTRYLPGAEIARGGMGRVVVGTDTRLGREVAIKEALPQGGDLERFEREVRITARLEHPSIVPLYDAGATAAGRPFYVMRKVSGQPLERLIAERSTPAGPAHRRRDADQRLALVPHVLAAANALGHAHRRGVIHRDVKPANILVGDLGETVVIDWGLAKVIGEDGVGPAPLIDHALAPSGELATQTGAVFGTPSFMAPEQARAEPLDARSDVYALGATLYHVLTGKPPLPGHLTEVLAGAHDPLRAAPALAELAALALPPELTAIVDKAMQFDPANRYPDGAALADDLNRFLAGRLVAAHRYTAAERLARFVRRHRALVAVIASSAIVLATGGMLAIRGIVVERERAQHAEQAAIAGRRAAEAARERETDRADDAVILRATAQVIRDPTSAIATLATLAPESRRWLQARAVALEARMRGIAQVYRAEAPPRAFELAPDPRSLLVADSATGRVSIIDLEHHRERELVTGAGRCTAAWGERGAVVWIAPSAGGLYAIDVATGARRPPVTGEQIESMAADPAATQLGLALRDGRAAMLTPAGLRYLGGLTGKVDEVRAGPDGSWLAFASSREIVVVDRDGRELARETDELQTATLARSASGRQLAILTRRGVVLEIELAGGHASTRRTAPAWQIIWIRYVGDELYVNLHNAVEMRPLRALDSRGAELPHLWAAQDTWQGYRALVSDGLSLIGPDTIALSPPVHDQIVALAARSDARYIAAHTRGAVITWDLGEVLPDRIARDVHHAWLFDDHTAVISDFLHSEWVDLATRAHTPIVTPRGVLTWQRAGPATGRQLLVIDDEGHSRVAVIARPGRSEATPVDAPGLHVVDFFGADLVVGTTTGELAVIREGAPPRVVHRFDAAVDLLITHDAWIVAQAETGMLARYNAATGATDTARPPFDVGYAMVSRSGDVYLASGPTLYRWRGRDFDRIAALPSPVAAIASVEDCDGFIASTEQRAVYGVQPDLPEPRRVTRLFFRTGTQPQIDPAGHYLAVNTIGGETTVIELSRGTRWQLPVHAPVNAISTSGRIAMLFAGGQVSIAHLDAPDDPAAIRAWILHATNYTPDATSL